jgi:hypothetical protein
MFNWIKHCNDSQMYGSENTKSSNNPKIKTSIEVSQLYWKPKDDSKGPSKITFLPKLDFKNK